MQISRVQLSVCLLLCTTLVGCAVSGAGAKKLAAKDKGSTVHLKVGDMLEVALEGNPTTGYTWEVAPSTGDVLAQQGEPDFKAGSSALGSGGIMTLRLKAVQPGTVLLRLIYHRTFEPGVAPLRTFEATVVVER